MGKKYVAYVGTYTHGTSKGIQVYDVNLEEGGFLSQKNRRFWKSGPAVDRSQEFSREKPKVSPVSICRKCAAPSMHIEIANAIM